MIKGPINFKHFHIFLSWPKTWTNCVLRIDTNCVAVRYILYKESVLYDLYDKPINL